MTEEDCKAICSFFLKKRQIAKRDMVTCAYKCLQRKLNTRLPASPMARELAKHLVLQSKIKKRDPNLGYGYDNLIKVDPFVLTD